MKKLSALALATVFAVGPGCGKFQSAPDKTVVVNGDSGPSSVQGQSGDPQNLDQLMEFIELYMGNTGVTRQGLSNLFTKYASLITQVLNGTSLTPDQLINILFAFDSNHDGTLTVDELVDGIYQKIPVLRWIPDNVQEEDAATLKLDIKKDYASASEAAATGLAQKLLRFDQRWAGGNGDGKVGRMELQSAGLILGLMQSTDFSQGLPTTLPSVVQQNPLGSALLTDQIQLKLNEQIFTRYPVYLYGSLSQQDRQIEGTDLALDLDLVDKLTSYFGASGKIPDGKQVAALTAFGPTFQARWTQLRKLYDNPLMAGDGDGQLNDIEAYNLITDLAYAQKIFTLTGGKFTGSAISRASGTLTYPQQGSLFATLQAVYPRVGRALFLDPSANASAPPVRTDYWDSLADFDQTAYGGDGNGALDVGELTMALATVRILDTLYLLYDTNQDGMISKTEATALFAKLGVTDPQIVDAFFADVGLKTGSASFWEEIGSYLSGGADITELAPYDFYTRMVEIMPRILDGTIVKPGSSP